MLVACLRNRLAFRLHGCPGALTVSSIPGLLLTELTRKCTGDFACLGQSFITFSAGQAALVSYTLACVTEHAALWYLKPAILRLLLQADDEQVVDSRTNEAQKQVAKVRYLLCVFHILLWNQVLQWQYATKSALVTKNSY